ncbi:MAG: hypothetical protein WEC37_03520 [Anaerolineales bacterium]
MKTLVLKTLLTCALLLLGSDCFVSPVQLAPTSTPTPSATPTPTTVWFPPTFTPSPLPTQAISPTPDLRPGISELLLEDDFSDAEPWSTTSNKDASVTVSNNSISLSLKSEDTSLLTTRTSPVFTDFYVEITAQTNLCSGADEYGLAVRTDEDGNHYRLVLSCDGRASVQRSFNGLFTRQTEWLESRAIPSLTPGSARLGVWAAGNQIRFFVNDLYLFTVTDSEIYKGTVGVFVHTSSDADVSVIFKDLQVWAIER